MIITKEEFKKLLTANKLKIRYIKNHIKTKTEYLDNPYYDPNYELGKDGWDFKKSRRYNEVRVPITRSHVFSEWWVCVPIHYRGIEVYMWFLIMRMSSGNLKYALDHIWNGGSGKKMRRDAQRVRVKR